MNGVPPEELVELRSYTLPAGVDYLWEWFGALSASRPAGFGVSAIQQSEYRAFFQLRGIKPTRWELDLLGRMDTAFCSEITAKDK